MQRVAHAAELTLAGVPRLLGGAHVRLRLGVWQPTYSSSSSGGSLQYAVAVKEVSLSRAAREPLSAAAACRLQHEADMLSMLPPHEHIVPFHGLCTHTTPSETLLQLVLAHLTGGTLADAVRQHRFEARHAPTTSSNGHHRHQLPWLPWLQGVAAGMRHIHSCGIVHRDLKPSNVMLRSDDPSDNRVAIIDFDRAAKSDDTCSNTTTTTTTMTDSKTVTGTLGYTAPEVLRGAPHKEPADVYSFAMLAYEVTEGASPHGGKVATGVPDAMTRAEFAHAVAHQGLRPQFGVSSPSPSQQSDSSARQAVRHLVRSCWHAQPEARPTFRDVCHQLDGFAASHPSMPHQRGRVLAQQSTPAVQARAMNTHTQPAQWLHGSAAAQSRRRTMEDRVLTMAVPHSDAILVAAIDGHGGDLVAEFVQQRLLVLVTTQQEQEHCSPEQLLRAVDAQVCSELRDLAQQQGCTITLAMVDTVRNSVEMAWLGDSDGVVYELPPGAGHRGIARVLTRRHRPDDPQEVARITALGGVVKRRMLMQDDGMEYPVGPARVYSENGKRGGLAVSRALGDLALHPYVTAAPETVAVQCGEPEAQGVTTMVMAATDGVWDVLSAPDACAAAIEKGVPGKGMPWDADAAAQAVVAEALARGTADNVGVALAARVVADD